MTQGLTSALARTGFAASLVAASTGAVHAQSDAAKPGAPVSWWDSFKISGYADAGITGNPDAPNDGINFGHLYTDRANLAVLNQASLILSRPTDPKATGYDWGFTLQGMYGTDARYTHFFNEFDRSINSRYQFDVVEADILAHLPWLSSGGIDLKVGQFPSPVGYEVINPSGNPLYSHSYIYNFGVPLKHTGAYAVAHATDFLDLYLGGDFGNLAQFGRKGDNNSAAAGLAGVGLNLLEGKLTILALTHIGPENAANTGVPDVNGTNRYFNDLIVTWKASDALTFTTEANYVKDDVRPNAEGYGIAQYVSYQFNDWLTLQARGEVWRDQSGFFVAAFPRNFDFTNASRGFVNTSFNAGKAIYTEATVGLNIKLPVGDTFSGTMLRPELRYDHAEQARPFNDLTSDHQFTGADLVLPFSF